MKEMQLVGLDDRVNGLLAADMQIITGKKEYDEKTGEATFVGGNYLSTCQQIGLNSNSTIPPISVLSAKSTAGRFVKSKDSNGKWINEVEPGSELDNLYYWAISHPGAINNQDLKKHKDYNTFASLTKLPLFRDKFNNLILITYSTRSTRDEDQAGKYAQVKYLSKMFFGNENYETNFHFETYGEENCGSQKNIINLVKDATNPRQDLLEQNILAFKSFDLKVDKKIDKIICYQIERGAKNYISSGYSSCGSFWKSPDFEDIVSAATIIAPMVLSAAVSSLFVKSLNATKNIVSTGKFTPSDIAAIADTVGVVGGADYAKYTKDAANMYVAYSTKNYKAMAHSLGVSPNYIDLAAKAENINNLIKTNQYAKIATELGTSFNSISKIGETYNQIASTVKIAQGLKDGSLKTRIQAASNGDKAGAYSVPEIKGLYELACSNTQSFMPLETENSEILSTLIIQTDAINNPDKLKALSDMSLGLPVPQTVFAADLIESYKAQANSTGLSASANKTITLPNNMNPILKNCIAKALANSGITVINSLTTPKSNGFYEFY